MVVGRTVRDVSPSVPYHNLTREQFDSVVQIMAEGITDTSGRGKVYLHHDRVKRRLRSRPAARIAATSNAGAIPDIGSYRVVADPDGVVVGTIDEDFAVESQGGDIFLLGTTSWRFQGIRGLDVVVTATLAARRRRFRSGAAKRRAVVELSEEVSRLRQEMALRLEDISRVKTRRREALTEQQTAMKSVCWVVRLIIPVSIQQLPPAPSAPSRGPSLADWLIDENELLRMGRRANRELRRRAEGRDRSHPNAEENRL